ncbi:MAG: hypothetical protein Q4C96_01495 [Planctomycetia bacterium]|nr:hypothetical protein [Planctomycetia bacterium]
MYIPHMYGSWREFCNCKPIKRTPENHLSSGVEKENLHGKGIQAGVHEVKEN